MILFQQYVEAKKAQKEAEELVAKLESNSELMRALEFKDRLMSLMNEYGQTSTDVANILGIGAPRMSGIVYHTKAKVTREVKVYINPNSGERVETKGGNHKILNEWKRQFGKECVESWVQE